jgi:hypothetical protein
MLTAKSPANSLADMLLLHAQAAIRSYDSSKLLEINMDFHF